jgi:hypothetical protein
MSIVRWGAVIALVAVVLVSCHHEKESAYTQANEWVKVKLDDAGLTHLRIGQIKDSNNVDSFDLSNGATFWIYADTTVKPGTKVIITPGMILRGDNLGGNPYKEYISRSSSRTKQVALLLACSPGSELACVTVPPEGGLGLAPMPPQIWRHGNLKLPSGG